MYDTPVFHELAPAMRLGYQIYARTPKGYLLRIRREYGWSLAVCKFR